ncbi:hypothetical protein [Amphiplicatus metriothermophilus]|uniref:Uncharacterized protein n=1 Tax=Amphiplicatus metriothermophilus TaxID=1519374 RepID=A0A239PPE1_9PROT|nr:hypothetical protein [Amphiplicatus metriothermophilus]MBB5518708.1 hypothetical protein [Amphiplicatus metriothermophilus]SNT72135.1 hypothetical protein SAMN06297382_1168 [Amphiplicatus metriothermophilus]
MSRIELTTGELFLRLGPTPRSRSARADRLFRRLRSEEEEALAQSMLTAPRRLKPNLSSSEDEDKA